MFYTELAGEGYGARGRNTRDICGGKSALVKDAVHCMTKT